MAIYNAVKVYLHTRKERLVDSLHQEGLAVSIDCLRTISVDIANSVIEHWAQIGAVVPLKMNAGFFTTVALNNLDHNLTSTTARSSFHGTRISLAHHEFSGAGALTTSILNPSVMGKRAVSPLPAEYTNIPEVSLTKDETISVPLYDENINITPTSRSLQDVLVDAYKWLEHGNVNIESAEWISWTAYTASLTSSLSSFNAISQMLPMFSESSSTPAMVFHGMNVIKAAIHHLDPGQISVMAVNQPLYTYYCKTASVEISRNSWWKMFCCHSKYY